MRELINMKFTEKKEGDTVRVRPSVRSLVIKNGKIALLYSKKNNTYKFPGGGIEKNETHEEAIIRETREEAGLVVKTGSVREFGYIHRYERYNEDGYDIFDQENYLYLCEVEDVMLEQQLEEYEIEEGLEVVFIEPQKAIETNRKSDKKPEELTFDDGEAQTFTAGVLSILIDEGYFDRM